MYRLSYALINNDILKDNVKEITTKYNDYKYYIGVVKNNAYNHGINIVNSLIQGGCNYLATSSLEEALNVRHENALIPILVLEPINLEYMDLVIKNNITITIDSLDYLQKLIKLNLKKKIKVHFKLDVGMNRLGFKDKKELDKAYKLINEDNNLELEGIFSHFATNGYYDIYYDQSLNKIKELLKDIDLSKIPILHFDRSNTLVSHPKIPFATGVRLGIIMYGFNGSVKKDNSFKGKLRAIKRDWYLKKNNISRTIDTNDLKLKTAFTLYSRVISVRKVIKGERVGYNASYEVEEDAYIATVALGYADGVTKQFGKVIINDKSYPIVSDSMDMIMVLVDKSVKVDDEVEIFGDKIKVKDVCKRLKINSYHLFNQITNRVPRIHIEGNKKTEIKY